MDLRFSKITDTEHVVRLDSHLISASWSVGKAVSGRTATFAVYTAFVGDGAPIKVIGRSEGGTRLGKIRDEIRRNRYIGEFEIPDNVEVGDKVYFEVKLPRNRLEGESNHIPVFPSIEVFNLNWSATEARRGDVLTLSAETRGLNDHTDVVVAIFEYDRDEAHDRIVELPAEVMDNRIELDWQYEYHEDTDEIATQQELERHGDAYNPPEYFFTVRVENIEFGTGQESELLTFMDWLEVEFVDREGNPMADERYVITLADGTEREGTLDENGCARLEDIPPGPYRVEFPDAPAFGRVGEG
jgi:hypothetical protein